MMTMVNPMATYASCLFREASHLNISRLKRGVRMRRGLPHVVGWVILAVDRAAGAWTGLSMVRQKTFEVAAYRLHGFCLRYLIGPERIRLCK